MRRFFLRIQLALVSILLLVTFAMMMKIVFRYNRRWDLTPDKLYSLSQETADLLSQMRAGKIEVIGFYPANEAPREDFEIFLRACQMQHGQFEYNFYDPNRRPQLAKQWRVKELYTVILQYQGWQERVVLPNEETFATTLLRLLKPRDVTVCFLAEREQRGAFSKEAEGFSFFREHLEDHNYSVREVLLARGEVPDDCQTVIVTGPQTDWSPRELAFLGDVFYSGRSVFFLVDPMDPGTGGSFDQFMRDFGIELGSDVVVDKMSHVIGGDFLAPFVEQYASEHPIGARFHEATIFPVARSVRPTTAGLEIMNVSTLAFSGSNSWAETNLPGLQKGEATFESETDFPGPISLAVTVEERSEPSLQESLAQFGGGYLGGRMVVVGDSDFLTNAYIILSGNRAFGMRIIRWLTRDERNVVLEPHHPQFEPLFLTDFQRLVMLVTTLLGYPVIFFVIGAIQTIWRRRTA